MRIKLMKNITKIFILSSRNLLNHEQVFQNLKPKPGVAVHACNPSGEFRLKGSRSPLEHCDPKANPGYAKTLQKLKFKMSSISEKERPACFPVPRTYISNGLSSCLSGRRWQRKV